MISRARFVIRFDDICPTMNWGNWEGIEEVLRSYRVKPILAVVPDNKDPKLDVCRPNPHFWDRVRQWHDWGWEIALHGYQHTYVTRDAGVMGLNFRSEFAGVSEPEQRTKIGNALQIFERERLRPNTWVAPGHSFDSTTLKILFEYGLRVISDGFFLYPVRRDGCVWIPQQLWCFLPMPFGVWTVCYHHNGFTAKTQSRFAADLEKYQSQIIDVKALLKNRIARELCLVEVLFSKLWLWFLRGNARIRG